MAPVVLGAVLALGAPFIIIRRLRDQTETNFMTVAGALCVYLLAGLFFSLTYWSLGVLEHGHFAGSLPPAPPFAVAPGAPIKSFKVEVLS